MLPHEKAMTPLRQGADNSMYEMNAHRDILETIANRRYTQCAHSEATFDNINFEGRAVIGWLRLKMHHPISQG